MAFGYAFTNPDEDQKKVRRHLLELYPLIAQWSVLVPIALFQLKFFLSWLAKHGLEYERPRSPSFNKRAEGKWTWLRTSRKGFHQVVWWTKKPVVNGWGNRAEWIGGGVWTVWLLYLSAAQTTPDYLHLTKRFGIIGASQLPFHYLLAMRSPYSPIQFLTRMSHEELKSAHQILGRIIYLLLALHAAFYMNFFVVAGYLAKRIKDRDVIFGIISITLFSILSTTALGILRRWNYRVFYITHVVIANLILIPLWIHVTYVRIYVIQALAVNIIHLVLRVRALKVYSGSVKLLPGTNLVQVCIPLTVGDSALKWKPGQHAYLSRPSGKSYSGSIPDQFVLRNQTNPFTIASIPAKDKELVLVTRTLNGNTKHLAEMARSLSQTGLDDAASIPLALEGPYGASKRLPDFSTFDKILLVAGGVGATFVMPVYRSIVESHEPDHAGSPPVRFIWSVRKLADTQWAFPSDSAEPEREPSLHDSVVEVFVTRPSGPDLRVEQSSDAMELAENDQLLSMEEQMERPRKGVALKAGRPDLSKIVGEVFSKSSRVAVISCGPQAMMEQLDESVEQWVAKGHDVYWHTETFGW